MPLLAGQIITDPRVLCHCMASMKFVRGLVESDIACQFVTYMHKLTSIPISGHLMSFNWLMYN